MNDGRASPLTGQMTVFLVLFLALSLLMVLLMGKSLEIGISDFWGNKVQLPVAPLVLGCLAIVLFAHFGARILTLPVLTLEEWARDDSKRIPRELSERPDELGRLARALLGMRNELEEAGNRLRAERDLYVALHRLSAIALAGEPGLETIKKLLSEVIKESAAEMALLVRRDPDGGGFSVIASGTSGDRGDSVRAGGMIPDALVPYGLLVRYLDVVELPVEEMDPEIVSWLGKHLGGTAGPDLHFVNIPVEIEGRHIGSLLLARVGRQPPVERLRPFADHIVGSAKYIEASIQREENWNSIMMSLSRAVDAKSSWTNGHSGRVAELAVAVGSRLMMNEAELRDLRVSSLLHDVGKIAIPEAIIDKAGKLERAESEVMRQHPERGAMIVEDVPGYKDIRRAILHHHERWDGTGYPHGLAGKEIPLHARIIAIADVYDALTSDRPYREGLSTEAALSHLESQSATAFDPGLLRIFDSIVREG